MASWIKMRTNLDTDPRVVNIAAHTEQTIRAIVGCLHFLWSLADEHTTNGRLLGYTPTALDHMTVPRFAAALQLPSVNWIKVDTDGFVQIADFKKHNGESAKRRARNAVRAAGLRDDGERMERARNAHGTSTKPAPRAEAEQKQSRASKEQALPELNTKSNAALLVLNAGGTACSLLASLGFDEGAIRAMTTRQGVDDCTVEWACSRLHAELVRARTGKRKGIPSPQGYVRSLIEGNRVPRRYRDEWAHKRINAQASSLKIGGAA